MRTYDDSRIDAILWKTIGDSTCPDDLHSYLRHRPEQAIHREEAMARLIELDDAGTEGEARYVNAVAEIRALAEAGDPTAQFHMGKLLDLGLGVAPDREASSKWYRLAILQGETRSMANLANNEAEAGNHAEARRLNELAAEHGETHGLIGLGRMYRIGAGVEASPATALNYFREAWEAGDPLAAYWIGTLLMRGDGNRRDPALGREWLEKAALAGCNEICTQLGNDCEYGTNGAEKNPLMAIEWYRLGAERGDVECQKCLGAIHLSGDGIPKDGAEAVTWLKRAAVQGHRVAQRILGLAYLWGLDVIRNPRFGRKWLERAAQANDSYACYQLARLLQVGNGESPDYAGAFRWFDRAARLGDADAQGALGLCYWKGEGVAKDDHAAYKWIRLAALQGDAQGLYLLGWAHHAGIGVDADFRKGAVHYRQAAEKGHAGGQARLGHCYLLGDGVEPDVAEAGLWLSRGAEQGNAEAACTIGLMLLNGKGVESNPGEASKWFLDAAEKGDSRAQYELAMLYAEGNGLARNLAEARTWMEKAAAQDDEDARAWLQRHAQLELATASEET